MKVVYATATTVIGQARIMHGTHWPADDPIVQANPAFFSSDPRYGLNYSAEPAGYQDAEPEAEPDPEPAVEEPRAKRAYVRRS